VSQVFQTLTHPLSLAMLLLAAGILFWKRGLWGRTLCGTALSLIVLFGSPLIGEALERSLEDQYPDAPIETIPAAQAIVVLGGSVRIPNRLHRNSALIEATDRELRAVRLYQAGKAPLVVAAGGGLPDENGHRTPESHVMSALLREWGVPEQAILIEDRSVNTHENALFSFEMLSARQIRRILLVTSASHMPRAAAAFRKAGFDVVPAPADFHTGWTALDLPLAWLPRAEMMVESDIALKEWLGILVYRLRGWA
jgi:uncharacterized SAM-binding protein YcdF (DUF218 family)